MIPTQGLNIHQSAFSVRLSEHGFNFYEMFAPDLMHEFELGVWKATLTHLLRILHSAGNDKIQSLNWRFRETPTFGRGTIRKFHNNVSGMKKLAARDFEDILQVSFGFSQHCLKCIRAKQTSSVLYPHLTASWTTARTTIPSSTFYSTSPPGTHSPR